MPTARSIRWLVLAIFASLVLACGAPAATAPDAAPPDAARTDASAADASPSDAAVSDAGASDADTTDAGGSDAGTSDAGGSDAGTRLRITLVGDRTGTDAFAAVLGRYGTVTWVPGPALATITPASFADADLWVVLQLGRTLDVGERAALAGWVTTGGRLLVIGGYTADGQPAVESWVRSFSMDVDPTAVVTEGTVFVPGAVTRGALTTPPAINGAYALSSVRAPLAQPEIQTATTAATVAARYDSGTGGRVIAFLDETATLDTSWVPAHEAYWTAALDWLAQP